ncbi:hypothetical protein [Dyella lipolytica]|uniref:Uncharacterized protein n=1 Tax=Dyella lipolytica TaxID=1867835 RepID=A0ABW8J1G5_9GAMM|nr:hypothetical protein [Dyella lipolytica]
MNGIKATFMFIMIGAMSSFVWGAEKPAAHQLVDFLPIDISFSCQPDTLPAYRSNYTSASITTPGVGAVECIDKKTPLIIFIH